MLASGRLGQTAMTSGRGVPEKPCFVGRGGAVKRRTLRGKLARSCIMVLTRTYIYITVSHKSTEEMEAQIHFNVDQKKRLKELLAPKNASMWAALLPT